MRNGRIVAFIAIVMGLASCSSAAASIGTSATGNPTAVTTDAESPTPIQVHLAHDRPSIRVGTRDRKWEHPEKLRHR